MIAALYVETNGAYYGVEDIDPWDQERDARLYPGPYPVVAHPPCAAWCRLAGFREARFGYKRGDDGGCFEAALNAVQTFGGVLEHPAHSKAWDHYGLTEPSWHGGWTYGFDGSATAYIEQGRYGLPIRKATWLYAVNCDLPELRWGKVNDQDAWSDFTWTRRDDGRPRFASWRGRREQFETGTHRGTHKGVTAHTPAAFRDVLIAMARSVPA